MPKNIIIFSDGTGQAGGIKFDEARTNVYKLYRACRVAPDTSVNPTEQVAYYDPGLGSAADGGHFKVAFFRFLYNLASMATGLGITQNIIDCYAAIIRLYEDGDRVYLVGFSRGAYTVRTLAGVMAHCGIPRNLPENKPLALDDAGSQKLAEHAVKDVYQFCPSYDRSKIGQYGSFLMDTRAAIAAKFRAEHGCNDHATDHETANVFPYCIGVFDTVAALGHGGLSIAVIGAIAFVAAGSPLVAEALIAGLKTLFRIWGFAFWEYVPRYVDLLWGFVPAYFLLALILYLKNYLKWAPALSGYNWLRRIKTIHLTEFKQRFYDVTLNPNVNYARHAISIDENRADFVRVPWKPSDAMKTPSDSAGNACFEQIWFPCVHADVGGGYDENNSRLSDIALKWMLASMSIVPNGLKYDSTVLNLHPDPNGRQHDEQAGSWLKLGTRIILDSKSPIHKSVYQRFAAKSVLLFDHMSSYRPKNMCEHVDFVQYFDPNNNDPKPADPTQCLASDVEARWDKAQGQSAKP